jgi:hypothetical protein
MVWRVLVVLAFLLAITGSVYAFAAANTVPPTRLDDVQVRNYVGNDALKARDMAPPQPGAGALRPQGGDRGPQAGAHGPGPGPDGPQARRGDTHARRAPEGPAATAASLPLGKDVGRLRR